jgi:hypothetical protein
VIPIQYFTSTVLAEIVRRQPASAARTSFAWQVAVGPALARVTTVTLTGGVLAVRAADPRWVQEISRARTVIVKRLQDLLGPTDIHSLHLEL